MVLLIHKFHYIWGYPRVRFHFQSDYIDRAIVVAYLGNIQSSTYARKYLFSDRAIEHITIIQIVDKWFMVDILLNPWTSQNYN